MLLASAPSNVFYLMNISSPNSKWLFNLQQLLDNSTRPKIVWCIGPSKQ